MTDQEIKDQMALIATKFSAPIAAAATSWPAARHTDSTVPAAFLAALIGNETGGDPLAKRFESGVLVSLWKLLMGRTQTFGVFRGVDLIKFVAGVSSTVMPQVVPVDVFQRLDDLATSWGVTQIMGYHCLEKNSLCPGKPIGLQNPSTALAETVRLLYEFAEHYQLDVTADFEKMFRCWNGGHPDAQTFDPEYVPNGLARMGFYPVA